MVGKPLVAFAIMWLMAYPLPTSLSVAVALAQIGEFSFMLSRVGTDLGLLSAEAGNVVVRGDFVYRLQSNPLPSHQTRRPVDACAPRRSSARGSFPTHRTWRSARSTNGLRTSAIVVGYGPTGRTVTRLLRDNGFEPTVIDMNVNTVRELREQGVRAAYGDATHRDTLAQAGTADADHLILTSAGMADGRETIRYAKELNPEIYVLARPPYLRDLPALRHAGADGFVSAEGRGWSGLDRDDAPAARSHARPDRP